MAHLDQSKSCWSVVSRFSQGVREPTRANIGPGGGVDGSGKLDSIPPGWCSSTSPPLVGRLRNKPTWPRRRGRPRGLTSQAYWRMLTFFSAPRITTGSRPFVSSMGQSTANAYASMSRNISRRSFVRRYCRHGRFWFSQIGGDPVDDLSACRQVVILPPYPKAQPDRPNADCAQPKRGSLQFEGRRLNIGPGRFQTVRSATAMQPKMKPEKRKRVITRIVFG